jgi:hypothetical protein
MLLVPVAASFALLAGCTDTGPAATPTPTTNGVEALEADEILERAREALDAAGSYRVKGAGEADGEDVDVDIVISGDDVRGTLAMGAVQFEMLVVDGTAYFKGADDLWELFLGEDAATVAPLLQGKWVKLPAGGNPFPLNSEELLNPEGDVTKGEVTTVNGKPAIILNSTEGGDLYIALEGEPYPIQIVSDEGTIEFLEIGEDVTIEAPPASEVFDLSTLPS